MRRTLRFGPKNDSDTSRAAAESTNQAGVSAAAWGVSPVRLGTAP
jgi:hypothetical protein